MIQYSPWGRFGVCLFVMLSLFITNAFGVYLFATPHLPHADISARLIFGSQDGTITALAIMFTACVMMALCFGMIYKKTKSFDTTKSFFNLGKFSLKDLGRYIGMMVIILFVSEMLMTYFDSSPMQFLDEILTPTSFWWLMISVVVVAPIYEELVFRGLIFGVLHSDDDLPAIVMSSTLFSLVHLQYDIIGMMAIFLLGALFCHARLKHGLGLAIGLHFLNNAVAMGFYLLRHSYW